MSVQTVATNQTYTIGNKTYKVETYVNDEKLEKPVPLVAIPMMSDYNWQLMCLQDRKENPELYAEFEDVQQTIKKLEKWLSENKPQ